MDKIPHVALIIETSSTYGRALLEGVRRYMVSHSPWSVFLDQSDIFSRTPAWLSTWRGDGIICRTRRSAIELRDSNCALVDLSDIDPPHEGIPRIESDHEAIGRLAAEHLLGRGFSRFAFCGHSEHRWSRMRQKGYTERLRHEGYQVDILDTVWNERRDQSWEGEQERIAAWLLGFSGPTAVFAANDLQGQHVLDACARAELSVPEQIAVLGCDNDIIVCELGQPALSSIVPNAEEIGARAAEMLDILMRREPPAEGHQLIAPISICERQSTDITAIDDPVMQQALQLIREQSCMGLRVEELLDHLQISRTNLERRFRKHLDRSPHAEIRRIQINRAKELLAGTDLTLDQIARLCGFEHPEYLSVVFKRLEQETPGSYRQSTRSD